MTKPTIEAVRERLEALVAEPVAGDADNCNRSTPKTPLAPYGQNADPGAAWATAINDVRRLLADHARQAELWAFLGAHPGLEISADVDSIPEGEPPAWRVHRVSGGMNDREWKLIASEATPQAAIEAARSALSKLDRAHDH